MFVQFIKKSTIVGMNESNKKENKKYFFEKFLDITKIATLSALMAVLNPESGIAKDFRNMNDMRDAVASQSENSQERLERLQSEIREKQNILKHRAEHEGQLVRVNDQMARQIINENGDVITFGTDGKKWVSLTTANKLLTYFDRGIGFPDLVLVDQEKGDHDTQNLLAENLTYALSDFVDLSVMANTYYNSMNKQFINFKKENHSGELIVETLDMKTGKGADLGGSEAVKLMNKAMEYYLGHLGSK